MNRKNREESTRQRNHKAKKESKKNGKYTSKHVRAVEKKSKNN